MCNILSFEIVYKIKEIFLVLPLGGFFLDFQLRILEFVFSLLVLHFCLVKPVVVTLRQLILSLSSLDSLYKNKPPNIRMIAGAKKRRVQNLYGGFFTFCQIDMYGLECFRCVCHELYHRIYVTSLPYG